MPFSRFDRIELSRLRRDARNASAFKRRHFSGSAIQRSAGFVCADDNLFSAQSRFRHGKRKNFGNRKTAAHRNLGFCRSFAHVRRSAKPSILSFYALSAVKNLWLKVFLPVLFSALLFSCANPTKKERIAELNNSVFCISLLLKGNDFEKRVSLGTGFLIAENVLASALHVEKKSGEILKYFKSAQSEIIAWKRFQNGEILQFPLKLGKSDEANDLALFMFDAKAITANRIKPLLLADKLPEIGDEVLAIGYYGEYEFPFNSVGTIAMIDANEDVFSDLTLMPGNSGAPVCLLETGEVVGLTVGVLDLGNETVRYGIAKKAAKLKELLNK